MANDKRADGKDAGSAGNYQCVCCQCGFAGGTVYFNAAGRQTADCPDELV